MNRLQGPEPSPGDLRVRAASVNPLDSKIRDGAVKVLISYSFPLVLGNDLAGDVEAVGPGVTKFKVGDAILGFLNRKVDRLARERSVRFEYLFMRASGEQLEEIGALVDQGVIKPILDKTFPLEAAIDTISYVESGRAVGKVVVRVAD